VNLTDAHKKLAAAALVLLAALACGCSPAAPEQRPTPQPAVVVTVCSGCGTEWRSHGYFPPEPITKCPECPMSLDEFEALKARVRKELEDRKKEQTQ
jgi:hypothetical protein